MAAFLVRLALRRRHFLSSPGLKIQPRRAALQPVTEIDD
jgi:hypothetical protein